MTAYAALEKCAMQMQGEFWRLKESLGITDEELLNSTTCLTLVAEFPKKGHSYVTGSILTNGKLFASRNISLLTDFIRYLVFTMIWRAVKLFIVHLFFATIKKAHKSGCIRC